MTNFTKSKKAPRFLGIQSITIRNRIKHYSSSEIHMLFKQSFNLKIVVYRAPVPL